MGPTRACPWPALEAGRCWWGNRRNGRLHTRGRQHPLSAPGCMLCALGALGRCCCDNPAAPHLGEAVEDAAHWGGVEEGDGGAHQRGQRAQVDDARCAQAGGQVGQRPPPRQHHKAQRKANVATNVADPAVGGGQACGSRGSGKGRSASDFSLPARPTCPAPHLPPDGSRCSRQRVRCAANQLDRAAHPAPGPGCSAPLLGSSARATRW